ncbi:MAG: nucleotidyltransferase family protein [Candidatus Niyogibacteria bacterium]|nr:nucleotidyltransferase family protein [Candidatus Niyogibacteria bacterium]
MKAIILAAGKGKRMRPLTMRKPKPLVRVRGKTFLEHILNALPSSVDEIIIVIGYKGKMIKGFLGNSYRGKKIIYVVNDKINLGTAHSLLLTKQYFKKSERFLLIYADELPTKKEVVHCLKNKFSWLTKYYDKPEESAVVTLARGRIVDVEEKPKNPKSNFVVGGLMVINSDIFKYRPIKHRNGEYYITSMMKKFIKTHRVMSVRGRDNLSFSTKAEIDKFNKNY